MKVRRAKAEGALGRRARVAEGRRMKEAKSLETIVAVVCCVRVGYCGRAIVGGFEMVKFEVQEFHVVRAS